MTREQEPRGQTLHATFTAPAGAVQPPVHGGCPVEREAPVEEPGHRGVVGVPAAGRVSRTRRRSQSGNVAVRCVPTADRRDERQRVVDICRELAGPDTGTVVR